MRNYKEQNNKKKKFFFFFKKIDLNENIQEREGEIETC